MVRSSDAALVGPGGYTNDFAAQPVSGDWGTFSRAGGSGDQYALDTDVNSSVTVATAGTPVQFSSLSQPDEHPLATWSSPARFLQTRPTQNGYTGLMGKFINNSGTNATTVNVSYVYTILGGGGTEEGGRGTHVYFSRTGQTGSWTNLPTLTTTAIGTGAVPKSTNVSVNWPDGGTFYVLWADDNSVNGTDAGHQIDNFSLRITSGTAAALSPIVVFTDPTNNATFLAPASITLNATATDPDGSVTNVEFFVDGVSVGQDTAFPYSAVWNTPSLGSHVLYAIARDNQGRTSQSSNINVTVFDSTGRPLVQITTPPNGAIMEGPTNLTLAASALAINGVTNVEFYAGNTLIGSATGAPPNTAQADYQFQNNLATSVGTAPALVNVGPNQFTTEIVDGQSRTVLRFAPNNGLTLSPATTVISSTVYTIAMLFSFDDVSSWSRILDFKNGATDFGLYIV
ncbi:MAG TPA: Ig-like domain-containing protein, partial [Candidatus Acidoferrum sp.]|nr:Ig-like domain-containing protein [Candidatus Acidoferrum sp.]